MRELNGDKFGGGLIGGNRLKSGRNRVWLLIIHLNVYHHINCYYNVILTVSKAHHLSIYNYTFIFKLNKCVEVLLKRTKESNPWQKDSSEVIRILHRYMMNLDKHHMITDTGCFTYKQVPYLTQRNAKVKKHIPIIFFLISNILFQVPRSLVLL